MRANRTEHIALITILVQYLDDQVDYLNASYSMEYVCPKDLEFTKEALLGLSDRQISTIITKIKRESSPDIS